MLAQATIQVNGGFPIRAFFIGGNPWLTCLCDARKQFAVFR